LYDSNALWNRNFPKNLKIIVINNAGGGIFRIIEGPDQTEELEEFFETYHHADISKLVQTFGIDYLYADGEKELQNSLDSFLQSQVPVVLEVKTKAELNPVVLKNYFKFIRSKIEKELKELIKK
jgi:2-succinyl-5-enolpyruvyl-6-hydroxy-3-cyclohexene-1-carboxylate synthase